MTTATKHLESAAHLCASLQAPYATIRGAIESLAIEPCVTLNAVDYYAAEDCERVADVVRKKIVISNKGSK